MNSTPRVGYKTFGVLSIFSEDLRCEASLRIVSCRVWLCFPYVRLCLLTSVHFVVSLCIRGQKRGRVKINILTRPSGMYKVSEIRRYLVRALLEPPS